MIVKQITNYIAIKFNNVNPNGDHVVSINCNFLFSFFVFENC